MPKSQIRPPRTPRGEDPAVTIANQTREIDNLIDRVQALVKERDEAEASLRSARDEIATHKRCGDDLMSEIASLTWDAEQLEKAHIRLQGWQDCAREVIDKIGTVGVER